MARVTLGQSSFNQGEIGPFMEGRADNEIYRRAMSVIENWIVVPQGGLLRRPGLEFVYDAATVDSLQARLTKFSFNKQQEYVLLWSGGNVRVFRQKALASTVPTPFTGTETRTFRQAQSGDSLIVTHFNHPPQLLQRLGSDTAWGISELVIDPLPYFQFNRTHRLTIAGMNPNKTATLVDSEEPYWNAGHFRAGEDPIKIRLKPNSAVDPDPDNSAFFAITRPGQDATGGTPLSSAGVAANAFDGSDATVCEAGVNGWVGYDLDPAKRYTVVGFRSNLPTREYELVFETAKDAGFTEPTVVAMATFVVGANEWAYIDLPRYSPERYFRLRQLNGDVLNVTQLILNEGLVAIGETSGDESGLTYPTRVFPEQGWGLHHGYPRTVEFIGNRLAFGGTRDEPATIFFGKDGDLFNFDDNKTDDDSAFARTLSTDENHFIRDMKAERAGLVIFTSDGVFNLDGDGAPITPTNVSIQPQSRIGVSRVAVAEVDANLIYNESNGKSISAIFYNLADDRYVLDQKTTLAHHLFTDATRPRGMAGLRGYKDTQANLLFVPREDGEMAVLTQDQAKQVQGWSRFKTFNPDGSLGKFRDAVVVETDHGDLDVDGLPITVPTLYALVERVIDGQRRTFLEALTEEDVYLDHWYIGNVINKEVDSVEIFKPGSGYEIDDILAVENSTETRHIVLPDANGYLLGMGFEIPANPDGRWTIEVDVQSSDESRDGTPFSYAMGDGPLANALVLNNLNSLDILIGDVKFSTGHKVNDGERHRLTIVYFDPVPFLDNVYLYDNGELVASAELTPSYSLETGGIMVLGQEQDSLGGGFDPRQALVGSIHRFRIWSDILLPSEIKEGRSFDPAKRFCDYQFNEGKGTTTVDGVTGKTLSLHVSAVWSFVAIQPPEKATLKVTDVGEFGAITGVKVRTGGDYPATPENPAIVTGGSGIGAEVNLTFRPKPKADWSGIDTLPNSEITVVGDGFVVGDARVDAAGNFTIGAPVERINAGIGYPSFGETLKLAVIQGGQVVRGKNIVLKEAVLEFDETLAFNVNGYPVYFRTWDNFVFETGLRKFTGQKRVKISNRGSGFQRDPKVNFSVMQPVAAHLLSLTLHGNIGL